MVEIGRYTPLVNADLSPREAMIVDLTFVREMLISAGIRFHLVRGNDVRPTLVIDNALREILRDTLVSSAVGDPLVLLTEGKKAGPPVLVADGLLQLGPADRSFVLYRPRAAPFGGLCYGAESGVRIELWVFTDELAEAPLESALTRRLIPRSELAETTVERYGFRWLTYEPMFDTLASDVTFDIDMVFSWVDGTDVEFQRARARQMQSYVVGEGDDHEARFRQLDELRYALRSVHLFAPWVRRIFVVTDSPAPYWLAEHPGVTIVRSEDFFADPSVLPTHNSQAVESQLQHIPGIAEHFLYSNDDMFFGRPVTPGMFFSPGGVTRFVEATTRIGLGTSNTQRSGFENSARVNRTLLSERFGVMITRHLEHCAAPLRRDVLLELESEFSEDFARTAASRFRSATDISVTNSLYHYYALLTGRAVVQEKAKVRYVDTTVRAGLVAMEKLLVKRNVDMFCLNDGSFPEISTDERAEAVRSFLDNYFPIVAPWEHVEALAAEAESSAG
ncbi:MAG: stealth family protein [Microbacteriaceae bacterium]